MPYIKKTWLAPSLQATAVALVARMRWPRMAECPCSQGWRKGTFQKVYNYQLYFLTSAKKDGTLTTLILFINSRTPLIEPSPPNVTLVSKLDSGDLTAHKTLSLVLLPSRSDTVRSVLLRKTKISSLPTKDSFTGEDLSREFHLARAGCKLQGTATSPSSTAKSIIAKYRKLG